MVSLAQEITTTGKVEIHPPSQPRLTSLELEFEVGVGL